jgi:hypothetical protein
MDTAISYVSLPCHHENLCGKLVKICLLFIDPYRYFIQRKQHGGQAKHVFSSRFDPIIN